MPDGATGIDPKTDRDEMTHEEHVASLERDRLWCRAIIDECDDPRDIEAIVRRFNELRPD